MPDKPRVISSLSRRWGVLARKVAAATNTSNISSHHAVTHYTSGYWEIADNAKRQMSHYEALAIRSLELMRGGYVTIHTDSDWFADAARRTIPAEKLLIVHSDIESLPGHCQAKTLLQSWKKQRSIALMDAHYPEFYPDIRTKAAKDKGLVHFQRDLERGGESVACKLLSIWLSKLKLVQASHHANYFPAAWLAWADASLARFNYRRDAWDIRKLMPADGRLIHYTSSMYYRGIRLPLNASFLLGRPWVFKRASSDFDRILASLADDQYCHDEETVLYLLRCKTPDLFAAIGPYRHL